jgi:hypothetical protein
MGFNFYGDCYKYVYFWRSIVIVIILWASFLVQENQRKNT